MRQVVVTGLGAITPLGSDGLSTWENLLAGKSGVSTIEADWVEELPVHFAGQVKADVESHFSKAESRRLDALVKLALIALDEAWADAGFGFGDDNPTDPTRTAVSVGTGIGGLTSLLSSWDVQKEKGVRRMSPFTIPMLMANAAAAQVGLKINAKAGVHTPVSACASSNEAIGQGLDLIRLNRADVVVVGGAESLIHPFSLGGFAQMQALSKRNDAPELASRPWDVDRDGFVLGEGAVIMVLETLESAKARGAKIYATLSGIGITADSYDIVKPDPSGEGQSNAMLKALADASLSTSDVFHINAHATSTPAGDTTEAKSICRAFDNKTDQIVVTGTKSMTGHLLGAAGAMETFATIMSLYERKVPPTINLENEEPGLGINIAKEVTELPSGDLAALNNSFGFGGHNVAVALTNENIA